MQRHGPLPVQHVPFCPKKCVYCDFYSIPYDESLAHQYVTALVHEIEIIREKAGELSTVYIGGGTTTTLPTLALVRLMRSVRTLFTLSSDAEITIEANPGTNTRESVEALVGAGINRMSIGIQSFDDNDLEMLGRIYDFQDALKALAVARHGGITNLGIDLSPAKVGEIALFVFPVSLGILAFAGGSAWAILAFANLYGASNGVMTIVRGTVPVEIWGRAGYGGLTRLMATPVLLAGAAGPVAAAGVLAMGGGYRAVTFALVAIGVVSWAAFAMAVRAARR